ncbi:MAG: glycosyltransferase [Planctomycetia bacterium]|nr:glycosyltransferase [Planctomycetia bacterium]
MRPSGKPRFSARCGRGMHSRRSAPSMPADSTADRSSPTRERVSSGGSGIRRCNRSSNGTASRSTSPIEASTNSPPAGTRVRGSCSRSSSGPAGPCRLCSASDMRPSTRDNDSSDASRDVLIRGLRVSARSFAETVALLVDWAGRRDRMRYFACDNAYAAELACREPEFMAAMRGSDLLVADGAGILVASWILGGGIRERSVFYLGTSDETLAKIRRRHEGDFPNLRIAGMLAPPYRKRFSDEELGQMADAVNAAAPDVLWIGLGAPKQENWIHANRDRLRVPLCCPVGALFDYYAGNVTMPPEWMQRYGLHWLYRLVHNPRRLWRRSLDIPRFVAAVAWERLSGRRHES